MAPYRETPGVGAMGQWLDRLGGIVLDAGLSATILYCLAALGLIGCRQPIRRVYLARLVLVCSLALLPLAAFSPLPRVPVDALLRSAVGNDHALAVPFTDDVPLDDVPSTSLSRPSSGWASVTLRGLPRPTRVLVPLYVACATAGSAWLLLGYWGLGWLSRRGRPTAAETLALYDSLPWAGRRKRPALRVSDRVSRPVLVGALRPMILIPAPLDQSADRSALRLSLLHELAHAEACDPLFNLVGRLAQVFWFFLPPAWWVRAQLVLDHEFLADRRAAAKFGHLPAYASSLLGMATPAAEPETAAGMASGPGGSALAGSALVQRVLMLVRCPFPIEARPPAWWVWGLPVFLVLGTLGLSTLQLGRSSAAASPVTTEPAAPAAPHVFRLSRLTVPPRPAGLRGRAPLFELPVRLPATFDLTLHVWGTPALLPSTRVVGLRLGSPHDRLNGLGAPPTWHLVRVRGVATDRPPMLWVDDRPVPTDAERGVVTTWLSVEPAPNTEGQFQHLKLTW